MKRKIEIKEYSDLKPADEIRCGGEVNAEGRQGGGIHGLLRAVRDGAEMTENETPTVAEQFDLWWMNRQTGVLFPLELAREAWNAALESATKTEGEWRKEPPSEAGWWWWREIYTSLPDVGPSEPMQTAMIDGELREVRRNGHGTLRHRDDRQWWSIPIASPPSMNTESG